MLREALGLAAKPLDKAEDPNEERQGFTQISTDSRQIRKGGLFVALSGERFDGHHFAMDALKTGATGFLLEKGRVPQELLSHTSNKEAEKTVHIFEAENTLEALRKISHLWYLSLSLPTMVVAGSVGKTTCKEMLAALLSGRFNQVLKTQGSENGFLGIALTLLRLRKTHQAAVIEVGIDDIGAMQEHLNTLQPTAALVTAIGPEHLFQLKDLDTVAREEGLALEDTAHKGGMVIINLDDPYLAPYAKKLAEKDLICCTLQGNSQSYSGPTDDLAHRNLLTGHIIHSAHGQANLVLKGLKFENLSLPLPLPGEHNARNLLLAVAMARAIGQLSDPEILAGLENFEKEFEQAFGRSRLEQLDQTQVLCDYYNANPSSMQAALKTLKEISVKGQAWACLGDMRELGKEEEKFHRELAPAVMDAELDQLILLGPLMRHLAEELKKKKFKGKVRHFPLDSSKRDKQDVYQEMAHLLKQELGDNDKLLIKGSRGLAMEKIWQLLK